MLPLNLLGSRWSLAQASLNKDGASLHSMLTSDSRASHGPSSCSPLQDARWGAGAGPLWRGCPRTAGVKGSVGQIQSSHPGSGSLCSDRSLGHCSAQTSLRTRLLQERAPVSRWVDRSCPLRGAESPWTWWEVARVMCSSSGSPGLVRLSSWGTGVGWGLSVSLTGSLCYLWVLQGPPTRGPGA